MRNFSEILNNAPLLSQLRQQSSGSCQTAPIYLVGGAIREALLDRPVFDLDFVSPHDLTTCAQNFARVGDGHWFWLDQDRRQSRVIVGAMTYDFVSWRAASLAEDLALRDYTINAMALDLAMPLTVAALIDPLNGCNDLERRLLRIAGPNVLQNDPLRILKGIRHVAELGLAIEPATLTAMQMAAPGLLRVAPERVRREVWQILMAPQADRGLDALQVSGAGRVLFGPAFSTSLVFVQAALVRCRKLFAILNDSGSCCRKWLTEPVEQHLDRATLLTFSTVAHAIEASMALRLARNWRLARTTTARLAALDNIRTVLWNDLARVPRRPRAIALWAMQYSPEPVDLLLGHALQLDLSPVEAVEKLLPLLSLLDELDDMFHLPNLVDGSWVASELNLEGEMISAALTALRRAEIYGGVSSVENARSFLRREFGKKS